MLNKGIIRLDRPRLPEALFDFRWHIRCAVKILIVTDGSGGFGPSAGFHLGTVLDTLADDPWSHLSFRVTKAHRQMSAEDGVIDNFRFDTHDLAQYSQIWLFGVERTLDGLSEAELVALAGFMEGGGGVFATGDHENLGQAMCSKVPRVRSMRRWYYPGAGPNGEPVAPAQTGPERHDTVIDLSTGGNQSDTKPQPIRPRYYSRVSGGGIVKRVHTFPHPVLCGPNGVIDYLPDHMHEGLCEVPADLNGPLLLGGAAGGEYPSVDGQRPIPEVIAWARTRNTDQSEFGVLAAYNGHTAGKGRVVVDATWHHWFNINLTGFVSASDVTSPSYDPAVAAKWAEIQSYYRNVAVWLARPTLQNCIRNGGWLWALGAYDIQITVRKLDDVKEALPYYWQLGVFAKDALGRLASRCQTTQWIIDWLWPLKLPFRLDPWWQFGPKDPPPIDPPDWLSLDDFEAVVLGAGLHQAALALQQFDSLDARQKLLSDKDGALIHEVMFRGAGSGIDAWASRFKTVQGDLKQLRAALP